ncbi:Esterase FE4, partial [Zootermopsis nevadensis]
DAPIVMIRQGTLRGFHSATRKGRKIISFLSIPYAAPPIGELRFEAPRPPNSWDGTRDATEIAPMCLQPSSSGVLGQEDCLFLNVHTPKLLDEFSPPLPVMVWIHGGGFLVGTGNSKYFPPTYLLDHNVVLVTLNYRLGILGFLSAVDEVLPGNYGMKDQVAALVWVHENIKKFGGNPNCVTLFGSSAGGTNVHFHVLSPISKGLFHRAITQSGTALAPFAVSTERALNQTMKLASLLGCPAVPTTKLVTCLRTKNASDVAATVSAFQMWEGIFTTAFAPVVEHSGSNRFLPDTPLNILKANKSAPVPRLTGVNAQDGCIISESIIGDPTKVIQMDKQFKDFVLDTLYFRRQENDTSVAETIRRFYFGNKHIDDESVSEVTNMYTDSYFLYPMNWSATLEAAAGNRKVYVYYFTYVGAASNSILYGDKEHNYGSCHGDEILYLFPSKAILPNVTQNEQDHRMIDILTTLWTNFAKTGQPTDQVSSLVPVAWDALTQAGNYLEIGVHLQRRTNLMPLPVSLWSSVFQWAYNDS